MLAVRQLIKFLPAVQEAAREFKEAFATASPETAEELKLQEGKIYSQCCPPLEETTTPVPSSTIFWCQPTMERLTFG